MKKKYFYLMVGFLFLIITSCTDSTDEAKNENGEGNVVDIKVEIKINDLKLDAELFYEEPKLYKSNNNYYTFSCRFIGEGHHANSLSFVLSHDFKLINTRLKINYSNNTEITFRNYRNFSSYFFETSIIEHNISTNKIKLKLKGFVYKNNNNLNSDKALIEININDVYLPSGLIHNPLSIENNVINYHPQKFNFKLNNNNWIPTFSFLKGTFTSYDPFMVVLKLNPQTIAGNYAFNHTININTIKFYKFNVNTYQYDEFNAIGSFNISYREYHGNNQYTFFGSFNLTATNPIDSSEVYNLSEGDFVVSSPFNN